MKKAIPNASYIAKNKKENSMSDEINKIPYREGEPPPGPGYILVQSADTSGYDEGMWWVPPTGTKSGAARHAELDPLLPKLRWIWHHLSQHISWCRSFEEWELSFTRDKNPGPEVARWARHAYAYLDFVHKNPGVDKAALFGDVMSLMNGREDQIDPPLVAKKLKNLVANPPSELENIQNFTKEGRLKTKEKHLR